MFFRIHIPRFYDHFSQVYPDELYTETGPTDELISFQSHTPAGLHEQCSHTHTHTQHLDFCRLLFFSHLFHLSKIIIKYQIILRTHF